MIVRLQIKIKGEGREESIACPLIDWGVKLIKILQKCNTVLSFVTSSFLWDVLYFFLFSSNPPLRLYFYFIFLWSLSVQWMTCLLLANIMPLLTGLTGSQSHTMQKCLQTWLWRSCSSFSLISYTGVGDVVTRTGWKGFFLHLWHSLLYFYEEFVKHT